MRRKRCIGSGWQLAWCVCVCCGGGAGPDLHLYLVHQLLHAVQPAAACINARCLLMVAVGMPAHHGCSSYGLLGAGACWCTVSRFQLCLVICASHLFPLPGPNPSLSSQVLSWRCSGYQQAHRVCLYACAGQGVHVCMCWPGLPCSYVWSGASHLGLGPVGLDCTHGKHVGVHVSGCGH